MIKFAKVLSVWLMLSGVAFAQPKTINQLPERTAAEIADPTKILTGISDIQTGTEVSRKLSLDSVLKHANVQGVANVSALFSATYARDNQLFQTQGYTTEGVGANLYRYDAASTATIDGGFVLPGKSGTLSFSGTTFNGTAGTGRFIAVDQRVADVAQFGATGASSAVDTSAFNRIVATLSSGGVVYFPKGAWIGQFTLSSKNNISIVGAGKDSKLTCSAGENCIKSTSSDYLTVKNLWLYGSGDSAAAAIDKDNGIYCDNCDYLRIENCEITHHGLAGVLLSNCSHAVVHTNNIHDAVGFSTSLGANCSDIFIFGSSSVIDVQITNNQCSSANNVGIIVQPETNVDCRSFLINGNNCVGHAKYGILGYVPMAADNDTTLRDVIVSANVVADNKYCGIYLNSTRNATVVGNSTSHNTHASEGTNNGLVGGIFVNGCSGVTISGNTVSNEKWYGIHVAGHVDRATMRSGYSVTANLITGQSDANFPAIWISAFTADCSVTANTIKGNLPTGIYVDGTSGIAKSVVISGNRIDGVSIGDTTSRAINLNGSNITGTLLGNTITNYFAGLVLLDNAVINASNNVLTGCTYQMWINGTFTSVSDVNNKYSTTLGSYAATTQFVDHDNVVTRNGLTERSGTGTPEGAVTAIVGSRYWRIDGGTGTTMYVKESGSGNTGWVAK